MNLILRGNIPTNDKKNFILSQIGLVRINLFSEYYERVNNFEKNKQYDEALNNMNECVMKIAIPFITPTKKPSLLKRFINWILREKTFSPTQYVQEWKTRYHSWFEEKEITVIPALRESRKKEMFDKIKITFCMVYNVSFSEDNFPPEPTIVVYDPTYYQSLK